MEPPQNINEHNSRPDSSVVLFEHVPSLDGLRGIAVLLVMSYHLELLIPELHNFTGGGFLGVDVFFVLSGFLITSILIKEQSRSGTISLKDFFIRRTIRLVPAFWVFLIALFCLGNYLLPSDQAAVIYDYNNFGYAASYLMNWHRALGSSVTGNLNHTWSLAIEEQFYVFWSLVLFLAFSESRTRRQIAVGTGVAILVLISQRAVRTGMGATLDILYYSTDTRIDAILIGCFASMLYFWGLVPKAFFASRHFDWVVWISLFAIVVTVALSSHESPWLYFGGLSLFATAIAVLIIWLNTRTATIFNKILEGHFLRWLGRISYGLYLWHYVLYEFAKSHYESPFARSLVGIGLSLLVSSVSFYVIESPLLSLKSRIYSLMPRSA